MRCLSVLIAGLVLAQAPTATKDLPLTVKPHMLPKELVGRPLVSISEYDWAKGRRTVVFRYSFLADYASFLASTRKELKGWKETPLAHARGYIYERTLKSGAIGYQAVVVNRTKLVRDEHAIAKSKPLWDQNMQGWVWVSYNEGYR